MHDLTVSLGLPSLWSTILLHPFYDLLLRRASSSVPAKPCPTLEYITATPHLIGPSMPFVTLDPAAAPGQHLHQRNEGE